MFKRTLISCIGLLVLYSGFLWSADPTWKRSQSQWQSNVIKAEEYLYDNKHPRVIILGTSLSARLATSYLPPDYYSLAFEGLGIYEGLEILRRTHASPEIVLIEANLVNRASDRRFLDQLFCPGLAQLRAKLLFLRQKNQPSCVVFPLLSYSIIQVKQKILSEAHKLSPDSAVPRGGESAGKPAEYRPLVPLAVSAKDSAILDRLLIELNDYCSQLQGQSVQVIFFELPTSPATSSAGPARMMRQRLLEEFPPEHFPRIVMPDPNLFTTTDGSHLDPASASRYADYLVSQETQFRLPKVNRTIPPPL